MHRLQIITSFESEPKARRPLKPLKDWKPEIEELAAKAAKLRVGNGQPAIYSPAFSLVKASLEFARLAVSNSDLESLIQCLARLERELDKDQSTLYRSERF